MDEVHPAFRQAWAADYKMTGDQLSYWDRGAWPYEGGGYWFDGLAKLGYALHDDMLLKQAKSRFDVVASRMNKNGIIFFWWLDKNKPADLEAAGKLAGGEAQGWPIWANGLLGRAMVGYYAASQDKQVLRAMEMAYSGSRIWAQQGFAPTNFWPAFETYTWTGNKEIQKVITDFFAANKIKQTAPGESVRLYESWYNRTPDESRPWYRQPDHGVHFNESTIPWAIGYLWTGDRAYLDAPCRWYDIIERGDDGMQPHGVPVCDENSGPTGSLRGTETCNVSGYMWSQITLLRVGGQGRMADRVERAFFNCAPAVVSRDFKTHVYHQTPNRISQNLPGGGPYNYRGTQGPLCCTAALNRFLPNYIVHMWMATYDNGLAATHYGPCKVSALAADRVPVQLECKTDYPFNDVIDITVTPARAATFPLSFRIPGWCTAPEITLNGVLVKATPNADGFVRIERLWKPGDRVHLRFPMTVCVKTGHDNGAADTPYATVSYGPLLFVLPIPDTTDANTPDAAAKWNYALDMRGDGPGYDISVERRPMPDKWGWQLDAPLQLHVQARSFDWKPAVRRALPNEPVGRNEASPFQPETIMTHLPANPVASAAAAEEIRLIPYGCTKFRIAMFPITERAYQTLDSQKPAPPQSTHCWTYWYWHAKATKQGITRDLEAMQQQGIEGVLVFPFGEYMKPEWIPMFQHILDEAERLKLKIALNNDSFWSCQVPWMTPELAEKKLVYSELAVDGGRRITETLPAPPTEAGFYRDIVVLACPLSGKPAAANADAAEKDLKTARAMPPSYPTGGLDTFYKRSPEIADEQLIKTAAALDISDKLGADGRLQWDAPAGRWLVLRFGYTILRKECPDFFSREALDHHLRQSVEKLIPIAGRHVGTTWTHLHEDSYENGAQTWTPAFRDEFRKRRGYDMTPWLPVLAGRIVGSRALSDRFLHDYRCTISDLYVENHFQHFENRLHALGLKFSNEGGYGWASAIADGLRIESFAEIPMGEFWHAQLHPITGRRLEKQFAVHGLDLNDPSARRAIPYGFGLNSIRLAASAAHIYGRPYCQAEAFTSYTEGGYDLCNSPFSLKATGDRAFCDGLGRVAFHTYSLQRFADEKPNEVWLGVGIHFNRNITWWNQAHAFTDYLSRCQGALRHGQVVADFAYWTGDTMPYECPDRRAMRPALPLGCNADLVNTDVLFNRMAVSQNPSTDRMAISKGRLMLPSGASYRYLVLPPTRDTIEVKSLRKIKYLIERGATVVLGPRPVSAVGLENYPKCDAEVNELADAIWGPGEQPKVGQRKIGEGLAVWGRDLAELLKADGVSPDFGIDKGDIADFEWIHRRTRTTDLYFISNQSDREQVVDVRVRACDNRANLWDPVWDQWRVLPESRREGDVVVVPMRFAPRQSCFLMFDRILLRLPKPGDTRNVPAIASVMTLDGPWNVSFDPKWGGPASIVFDKLDDWTKRPEEGIKFYSSTATYRKTFDLPKTLDLSPPLYLDLGVVKDLAEVRLNGTRLGVVWTAPWRVDISSEVKSEGNTLEIDVVNQWPNRLIGDSRLPADKQLTKSNYKLKPDDPLVPSGLLGPVTLQVEQ